MKSQKPIQVAVVGAGHMGKHHARIYHEHPGCELVAVVDKDLGRARQVCSQFGGKPYASTDQMTEAIEAASVAVPTVFHADVAVPLIERGIPVLVEKPLAPDSASARDLVAAARRSRCLLQVGHSERFNPVVQAMLRMEVRPKFIETQRVSPFTFRSADIGVVFDMMIHDIDIVLHLVQQEATKRRSDEATEGETLKPQNVETSKRQNADSSRGQGAQMSESIRDPQPALYAQRQGSAIRNPQLGPSAIGDSYTLDAIGVNVLGATEDVANARIRFTDGAVASLTASRLALKTERRIRVFCPTAYLTMDFQKKSGIAIKLDDNLDLIRMARERHFEDLSQMAEVDFGSLVKIEPLVIEDVEPLRAEIQAFLNSVRTGSSAAVSAEEGFAAVVLAERITEAIRQQDWGGGLLPGGTANQPRTMRS